MMIPTSTLAVLLLAATALGALLPPNNPAADNLHFLPASTGAACLDGTPYAINVKLADPPSNASWTLSFEGGGWCYDEESCASRSLTHLGSSTLFPRFSTGFGGCMRFDADTGAVRTDCNVVHFPYCDGVRLQPLYALPYSPYPLNMLDGLCPMSHHIRRTRARA